MKKKLLSLFCALSLLLTLLPTSAFAVEDGAEETTAQTGDTEAAEPAPEELELIVPQVWEEFWAAPVTSLPDDDFPALFDDRAATAEWKDNFGDQLESQLPDNLHTDIAKTQGKFAKELYDALCDSKNLENLKTGKPVSITLDSVAEPYPSTNQEAWKTEFRKMITRADQYLTAGGPVSQFTSNAIAAFDRDHSDIFWLGGWKIAYGAAEDGVLLQSGTLRPKIGAKYSMQLEVTFDISNSWKGNGARDIDKDNTTVTDAVAARVNEAKEKSTTYDKLLTVHNWLTQNNAYNTAAATGSAHTDSTPWEAISALTNADSLNPVCEGYARAFKLICDKLNIPCVLVSGTAGDNNEAHMWNYVKVDGSWYAVDVTWDDPIPDRGQNAEVKTYFLVGGNTVVDQTAKKTFNGNHTANTTFITSTSGALANTAFVYPTLSDTPTSPRSQSPPSPLRAPMRVGSSTLPTPVPL